MEAGSIDVRDDLSSTGERRSELSVLIDSTKNIPL
jgi:hypothetical protein